MLELTVLEPALNVRWQHARGGVCSAHHRFAQLRIPRADGAAQVIRLLSSSRVTSPLSPLTLSMW